MFAWLSLKPPVVVSAARVIRRQGNKAPTKTAPAQSSKKADN